MCRHWQCRGASALHARDQNTGAALFSLDDTRRVANPPRCRASAAGCDGASLQLRRSTAADAAVPQPRWSYVAAAVQTVPRLRRAAAPQLRRGCIAAAMPPQLRRSSDRGPTKLPSSALCSARSRSRFRRERLINSKRPVAQRPTHLKRPSRLHNHIVQ